MRSGLVFAAKQFYPNRFELVHQASKFARRLHLKKERMGDTINQALERMSAPGESEGEQWKCAKKETNSKINMSG